MSAPTIVEAPRDSETQRARTAALLTAWARVWNPLLACDAKRASWEALGLPESAEALEPECWRVFHAAHPAPPAPLLAHALLGMDGAQAREDWLRAIHHLRLTWSDRVLPPDHLAIACEVLAVALENDDAVLVRGLCTRYLDPWCAAAAERLAGEDSPVAMLPACLQADLATIPR
ncbi:MAG: hypothetical protein IT294_00170 [Deltaproteobacteria bacterium]|nr:hypothetical protein [Deltaproteobacteria bacterium]